MDIKEALREAEKDNGPEPDVCVWPVPFERAAMCLNCGKFQWTCKCPPEEKRGVHTFAVAPEPQPRCVHGKRVFGPDAHLGAVGE